MHVECLIQRCRGTLLSSGLSPAGSNQELAEHAKEAARLISWPTHFLTQGATEPPISLVELIGYFDQV